MAVILTFFFFFNLICRAKVLLIYVEDLAMVHSCVMAHFVPITVKMYI